MNVHVVSKLLLVRKLNIEIMTPEEMVIYKEYGINFVYYCYFVKISTIDGKKSQLNPDLYQGNLIFPLSSSENYTR